MAREDRETAERHLAAFGEILRMASKVPRRLLLEAKQLDPTEERALADEGMTVRTGRLDATPPERE
jgi:hypothetical protein